MTEESPGVSKMNVDTHTSSSSYTMIPYSHYHHHGGHYAYGDAVVGDPVPAALADGGGGSGGWGGYGQ